MMFIRTKFCVLSVILFIISITVQLSSQLSPNVVNNKTEEQNDTKLVINVELTNTQKKTHTISKETDGNEVIIQRDEVVINETFSATEVPTEPPNAEVPIDAIGQTRQNVVADDDSTDILVGLEDDDEDETTSAAPQVPETAAPENTTEIISRCGDHETYQECGPRCYQTCTFTSSTIRKSRAVCSTGCNPGCYCNSGYVRFHEKCVLPESCPARPCRMNEEYTDCGTACPITCESHKFSDEIKAGCMSLCIPGCFCKDGYVRNNLGMCVLPTRCARPSSS